MFLVLAILMSHIETTIIVSVQQTRLQCVQNKTVLDGILSTWVLCDPRRSYKRASSTSTSAQHRRTRTHSSATCAACTTTTALAAPTPTVIAVPTSPIVLRVPSRPTGPTPNRPPSNMRFISA